MEEITGDLIYSWAKDMFYYNRSLSGEGVRQTLSYIKNIVPQLQIKHFKTGEQVFDWTVPQEWNIKDAYIKDEDGNKIIDFKNNNLHVVGYSTPIDTTMSFAELDKHLYSLEDMEDAIPYITSYYKERWGFCLTDKQRKELQKYPDKKYHVKIDSTLEDGVLNYGEIKIKGKTEQEVFLSTYVCHPSMGNNELSGPVLATALAKWVSSLKQTKYSYRIVFLPETIGSISYLSKNLKEMQKNIIAGYVLTCVGDNRTYSHIKSRLGNNLADNMLSYVLKQVDSNYKEYSFLDRGSDERQYCAPFVDLPVATFCRSKFAEYPEYHTSLDDLDLISADGLQGSFDVMKKIIYILENNKKYKTLVLCEPQLGKRGLYPTLSTPQNKSLTEDMMNLIAYSDGNHSLLDIAKITNKNFNIYVDISKKLLHSGILS